MVDIILFAGVAVFIILVIIAYLYYCGSFQQIEISTGAPFISNASIAYKFCQGPYEDSGRIFGEVSKLYPNMNCIGVYYDNPDKVKKENLRWAAGAILSADGRKLDLELEKKFVGAGFKVFKLPDATAYVRTTIPFVNTMSLVIGYRRVYPKLAKYIEARKLTMKCMVEIYADKQVKLMSPQDHQDGFFVPAAIAAETEEHRNQGK